MRFTKGPEGSERGFAAVRARYGQAMVDRIKNWPRLAENHCLAADGDEIMVEADVKSAERNLERARNDPDYALDQAVKIARHVPRDEWDIVPSVSQLRRGWGFGGTPAVRPEPPPKAEPVVLFDPAEVEAKRQAAEELRALAEAPVGPDVEDRASPDAS